MRTARTTINITCKLDAAEFADWNELTDEQRTFWQKHQNYTHCDGQGFMGLHCEGCPFCTKFSHDTEDDGWYGFDEIRPLIKTVVRAQ